MAINIHTFVVLAYKESPFLEECIKSVINQSHNSNVIIATTTPNDYITKLAQKYKLKIVTGKHTTIGGDFDFAKNAAKTKLVTIAHQDDIYEHDYAKKIINNYDKNSDSIIVFTDYYEIRNNKKVYTNTNLKIKRLLLLNLKSKKLSKLKFFKRNALRFGNAISCPAVTINTEKCPKKLFSCDLTCNIDWYAWEKLSKIKGKFIFINEKLMGHRIDETTTTTNIINKGIRTKEDQIIFGKFWPKPIANWITKLYSSSEKSNNINN